jgi:glycosyltransferase involved in cell wall biosynthesis
MRVLLIAEACNPEWVSVPLEGWSHSDAIRRHPDVDAHLVTQVRNRDALVRAGLHEGDDFTAIDSEALARPASRAANLLRGGKGKGWTTVTAISTLIYPYFERLVWKTFGPDIRGGKFDLVHRLTPLSPTTPSPLARKCARAGVPFILGPLNGGVPWPHQFDAARRREREWLSYVRGFYKLLPGHHATRRHASAIIVGSRDTEKQVPDRYRDKCVYVPENAIDPDRFPDVQRDRAYTPPIKAAFVGRLVPYKGVDMLIDAAAPLIDAGKLEVDVFGDGPERANLAAAVQQAGITDRFRLHGNIPHAQLHGRLAQVDVFAFPSVREFGGAVVLEAMALGVVPVVVDYGGPGELVTDDTGYRVPIAERATLVQRFDAILAELCEDPGPLRGMSERARGRARTLFTWDAKAGQVVSVYRKVLGASTADFTSDPPFPAHGGQVQASP